MSRSWMTGGGRVGSRSVKARRGVVSSRLEAPLRAVPHDHRRPSLRRRILFALEYLRSVVDEARARRRIRRELER